ncbi:MAG TPA: FkbM family methyltransferase [Parvularculaceae bacterium]|nr:FkbM family methyltransferase [Parvularculaceae bacterium]HNS86965.1 FkbM family methyltransferase [Parvularculaceae bacterium]
MQLPLVQRLKLQRQRALAGLRLGGNADVRLEETADGVFVHVEGEKIAVPSPLRWKLYRKGWRARLDQLAREYGVGRHVALGPESVVVDIGANAGEFAHVCARYGAEVFCFEPDPGVFDCLRRNAAALPKAHLFDDVIWKEEGEIDFALAPERADSSVFAEGPRIKKRAITLERFARERSLTRIDLVKCDAEGAEPEVLEGIGAAFAIIRAVALDTGAERKGARTNVECAAILRRNGFDVIEETVGSRPMTFGVRRNP